MNRMGAAPASSAYSAYLKRGQRRRHLGALALGKTASVPCASHLSRVQGVCSQGTEKEIALGCVDRTLSGGHEPTALREAPLPVLLSVSLAHFVPVFRCGRVVRVVRLSFPLLLRVERPHVLQLLPRRVGYGKGTHVVRYVPIGHHVRASNLKEYTHVSGAILGSDWSRGVPHSKGDDPDLRKFQLL